MGRHSPSSRRHSPSSRRHSPSSRRNRNNRSISPPPPREKQHQPSSRAPRPASRSPDPPPSYHSRSPSPRTKRLKKNQSEREPKLEHNRSHGSSRGRDSERETVERKERRVENEDDGVRNGRSSRSRHERSPENHRNGRSRHKSRSPPYHPAQTQPRDEVTNSRGAEMMNEEDDSIMKMKAAEEALEEKQKVKPSFELSGKLAAETNRVRGITLLFNEPPEARKPDIKWRLYVFKTGEMLNEPLYIHRQSCYLFGRERRVADVPTDHPSCSKQHAVIQFRQIEKEQPDGTSVKQTRPYIMDLGSTNKTFVNDNPIEPQRYYELREQDTIKFGNSSREYVLLHENSAS